jgi:hypothetical protein
VAAGLSINSRAAARRLLPGILLLHRSNTLVAES